MDERIWIALRDVQGDPMDDLEEEGRSFFSHGGYVPNRTQLLFFFLYIQKKDRRDKSGIAIS